MQISSLKLLNYRNYESLEISFSPYTNIIYGKNGMGKTNLVEAIYMLGVTKTFRLGDTDVVIKKGKNIAKIEGLIKDNIWNTYKMIISETGKRIKVDNNKITKMSDYITRINVILFNPDDLKIIKDTPMTRRKLLNIEISGINKEYVIALTNYNKILKQRNSYLKALSKKNIYEKDFLNVLTEQLIDEGLKIMLIRQEFIESINSHISDIYFKITNKGPLSVRFKSEYLNKTKEQLLNMYQKNISREIQMGKTLFGPQHDDIEFIIGYCDKNKRELISIKNKQLVRNCKVAWIGSWDAYNEFKRMENEIADEKIKEKQVVVFDENGKMYEESIDEELAIIWELEDIFRKIVESGVDSSVGGMAIRIKIPEGENVFQYMAGTSFISSGWPQKLECGEAMMFYQGAEKGSFCCNIYSKRR